MSKLFLLKPNFTDPNIDQSGTRYFCPYSALVNGVINYYPELKNKLEIHYVDFKRPRAMIIDLIGEENQSCPVLILDKQPQFTTANDHVQTAKGKQFINDTDEILRYLASQFGIGISH